MIMMNLLKKLIGASHPTFSVYMLRFPITTLFHCVYNFVFFILRLFVPISMFALLSICKPRNKNNLTLTHSYSHSINQTTHEYMIDLLGTLILHFLRVNHADTGISDDFTCPQIVEVPGFKLGSTA